MRSRARSPLFAVVVVLLSLSLAAPRPAAAFWSEVIGGGSGESKRKDDDSIWGATMCFLGASVLGAADVVFGVADAVLWRLGRKPPRWAAITEIALTLPQVILCAAGFGLLARPGGNVTLSDNEVFIGFNAFVLIAPLLLTIHGIYELATIGHVQPRALRVVPTIVTDGRSSGPGLAVGGVF